MEVKSESEVAAIIIEATSITKRQTTYLSPVGDTQTTYVCILRQNKNLNQIKILDAKYKGHGNTSNEVEIQTKTSISKIKFLVRV